MEDRNNNIINSSGCNAISSLTLLRIKCEATEARKKVRQGVSIVSKKGWFTLLFQCNGEINLKYLWNKTGNSESFIITAIQDIINPASFRVYAT